MYTKYKSKCREIMSKIRLEKDYIIVEDQELRNQIDNANLSATFINGYLNSPGDAILNKLFAKYTDNQSAYLDKGLFFHAVMEKFFSLDLRNSTDCRLIASRLAPKYSLLKEEDRTALIDNFLQFYPTYKTDEVDVINGRQGIEFCFNTKSLFSRPLKGYVDLILKDKVIDWKTGKYNGEISEDYVFQMGIYALALKEVGYDINKTFQLVYPMTKNIVDVDIDLDATSDKIKRMEDELNNANYRYQLRQGTFNLWSKYLLEYDAFGNLKFTTDITKYFK